MGVFTPKPRLISLYIISFGMINILGLDPSKARIGDIAIRMSHNGFKTKLSSG
jgi:hypothetical protein